MCIICANGCTYLSSEKACIMDADNTPVTQVTVIQVQTIAIKMRRLQVSNSRVGAREEAGELNQTILLYSQAGQGRKLGGIHIFSYLFPKTEWSSQLLWQALYLKHSTHLRLSPQESHWKST